MFQLHPKYGKLKKNLQLAKARLNILQAKNLELAQKKKAEIANYLKNGKFSQARISAHTAIANEANAEAMSLVSLFCEQFLYRYVLFQETKTPDVSLLIPVSSLIWVSPFFISQVKEMEVVLRELTVKYGRKFRERAMKNKYGNVSYDLMEKVGLIHPSKEKIETYIKSICSKIGIFYEEKRNNSPHNQKQSSQSTEAWNGVKQENMQSRFKAGSIDKVDDSTSSETAMEKDDGVKNSSCTKVVPSNDVSSNDVPSSTPVPARDTVFEPIDDRSESVSDHEILETEVSAKRYVTVAKTDEVDFNQPNLSFSPNSNLYNNCCNSLYIQPPPSYSQCINDSIEADAKGQMFSSYTFQFPTCPSENPDSKSDPVNIEAAETHPTRLTKNPDSKSYPEVIEGEDSFQTPAENTDTKSYPEVIEGAESFPTPTENTDTKSYPVNIRGAEKFPKCPKENTDSKSYPVSMEEAESFPRRPTENLHSKSYPEYIEGAESFPTPAENTDTMSYPVNIEDAERNTSIPENLSVETFEDTENKAL